MYAIKINNSWKMSNNVVTLMYALLEHMIEYKRIPDQRFPVCLVDHVENPKSHTAKSRLAHWNVSREVQAFSTGYEIVLHGETMQYKNETYKVIGNRILPVGESK